MKKFIISLCFSASLPLLAQQASSIQEEMANYNYETALMLIAKEKPTTQLLQQKAKALRGLNRYTEALSTFREALVEEPQNQQLLIEIAECCKLAGRFGEALNCYEQVLGQSPENKYVQLQRISLLCAMEQYANAKNACLEIAKTDSSTEIMRLLAQSYEGMKQDIPALECYQSILKKEPTDYISTAKLASLYNKIDQPQEAISVTERYRENDTTNIYVNRQNAQAYCLKREYPIAVKRYEYLISQGDSTQSTCYYLGMSYYATEKYYEAHDFLEIAHRYEPKNVNILYYFGMACSKTSWKKQGATLLDEAINLTVPADTLLITLYNAYVESCGMADMHKEKIEAYKELYKLEPRRHTILYNIASSYFWGLKDSKSTERYLEMFLRTKPKEDKDKEPYMEGGTLMLGTRNYYNAASRWLEEIKRENFFKDGKIDMEKGMKLNEKMWKEEYDAMQNTKQ